MSIGLISRFCERFRDGQYSLVSLLFAVPLLMFPRSQPFVKVGARAPVPYGVSTSVTGYRFYGLQPDRAVPNYTA